MQFFYRLRRVTSECEHYQGTIARLKTEKEKLLRDVCVEQEKSRQLLVKHKTNSSKLKSEKEEVRGRAGKKDDLNRILLYCFSGKKFIEIDKMMFSPKSLVHICFVTQLWHLVLLCCACPVDSWDLILFVSIGMGNCLKGVHSYNQNTQFLISNVYT